MTAQSWQAQAEMLTNRLHKNQRRLAKWSQDEGITCYRLYDRDIPQLPFVIDWYEGKLHVAEFRKRKIKDEAQHQQWCDTMMQAICTQLEIPPEDATLKQRQRQRGKQQYQRADTQASRFIVHEGGHRFWINLSDYIDTGLFLDHRPLRAHIQQEAQDKRFLNLFAYTGAFSVYAAAGGASHTTTVDMSKTYTRWAQDNFTLNGITSRRHRFVQADVFAFLDTPQRQHERYDLIVLDPPTFSTSKRMKHKLDIQRDYTTLLQKTLALLNPGGTLYFSTNFRKFSFDPNAIPCKDIQEISDWTVPTDFHDKHIHRAWRLHKP